MSLAVKFQHYVELLKTVQDKDGFIESDCCDSLLFSGLAGCVPGVKVNIDAAQAEDGSWKRRPTDHPCFPVGSKSSISRDMLLGLAWYAWRNKRLDISEGVIKYAFAHRFIMGEGVLSRTLMTPSLLATFAWISYRLGGPSRAWLRWPPADFGAKVKDYQAHLQCLHILLRKELTGRWGWTDRKTIGRLCEENPWNALFQAAAGQRDNAIRLLLDEAWWPDHRLPTSDDRKAQWLVMRDYGADWQPSDEGKTHSGADFLFVVALMSRI